MKDQIEAVKQYKATHISSREQTVLRCAWVKLAANNILTTHSLVAVAEAGRLQSGRGILITRSSGSVMQYIRVQYDSATTSVDSAASNSQTIQCLSMTKSQLLAVESNGSRMTAAL